MRVLLAALVLGVAGCMPALEQRLRDYNADGLLLFHNGDYLHVRDTFQAALAMTPGEVSLRYNLAQCDERLGQADQAEKIYRECLQSQPNNADCRHGLCELLVRQGRRDDAVAMVEDWLKHEPRLADAYTEDAWLWHQAGDLPVRLQPSSAALQFDPHNVRALTELALVYESLHYPDRALTLYEQALEVKPEQPAIVRRVNRLKAQGVSYPKPG